MQPILGATYQHYKGQLYMVTGFAVDEATGTELVLYASLKDGAQFCQPIRRFEGTALVDPKDFSLNRPRFELAIPAEPSIGLPAVAYLWTDHDVQPPNRMVTLFGDETQELNRSPNVRREALVKLSDAFSKWQVERVQALAKRLKESS